jgi:hypothetical protein
MIASIFVIVGVIFSNSSSEYMWLYTNIYYPVRRVTYLPILFSTLTIMQRVYIARDRGTYFFIMGVAAAFIISAPVFSGLHPALTDFTTWYWLYLRTSFKRVMAMGVCAAALTLLARKILGLERRIYRTSTAEA